MKSKTLKTILMLGNFIIIPICFFAAINTALRIKYELNDMSCISYEGNNLCIQKSIWFIAGIVACVLFLFQIIRIIIYENDLKK